MSESDTRSLGQSSLSSSSEMSMKHQDSKGLLSASSNISLHPTDKKKGDMKKDIPRSNPVIIAPVPNRRKGPVYYQPTPVPSVTERMALSGLKKGYGDHVMVDIASARAAEGIPEKEKSGKDGGCSFSIHLNPDTNNLLPDSLYAVKVGLCENFDGNKVLWCGETFITSAVRGPIPVFINSNGSPTKEVPSPHVSHRATDFESGVKTTMDALRKKKKKNNNVTVEKTQQPSKVEISGNGSCPSRISVTTNFAEGGYLAFELLHMNSSTSNGEDPIKKVIATTVFPLYFFHSFTAKTVISAWYPMREVNKISKPVMESQETLGINKTLPFIPASGVISEIKTPNGNIPSTNRTLKEGDVRTIKAIIHLVFEVPGGCPQQVERPLNSSPAQNMLFSMRVHDAKLFRTVEEGKTFLEKLVVTSSGVIIGDSFRPDIGDIADGLDVLLKRPPAGMYFSIRMSSGEKQSFRRTCHAEKRYKNKKTPSSYYPIYNQRFSWYQTEVKDSKCVSIYLKAKCGKYGSYSLFKFKPRVIGVAHIPIQYFLSHHSSTGADIIAGVTPPNEFPTLFMQKPVLLVDPDRPFILRGVAYVTIEAESTTKTVTDTKTGNTTTTYNFKKISKDPEPCGPRSIPDYGCAAEARRKSNDIQRDTLVPGKCVDPDNTNRLVYLDAIEFLEVGHLYKLDPNADTDVPQPDTDTESEESDTGESEVVDMKKCEPKKIGIGSVSESFAPEIDPLTPFPPRIYPDPDYNKKSNDENVKKIIVNPFYKLALEDTSLGVSEVFVPEIDPRSSISVRVYPDPDGKESWLDFLHSSKQVDMSAIGEADTPDDTFSMKSDDV